MYWCGYYTVGRLLNFVAHSCVVFRPYTGFSAFRCIIMSIANVLLLPTSLMPTLFRRVRKIAISDYLLCYVCSSVRPSVRACAWNNFSPTGCILVGLDIWLHFENLSRIFKVPFNLTRKTGTLHEDVHTFVIIKGKSVPLQAWSGPEGSR